ncbi:hypothetical protein Bbelb_397700 [Branchiostoma belcheri]|nr:hypothetical protein Bbelb_397700 [Branchiostoma belcheri]
MAALPPYRPSGGGGGGSNGIGMGNMAVGAVRMENFMAELPRSIFSWDGRNRTLSHDPAAAVVVSDMPLFRNALARHIQVNTDDELLDLRDAILRAPLWMTCTIRSQKSAISRLSSTGSDDYAAAEEESRIKGSFIMLVNTHHAGIRTQLLEAFAHAIGRASMGRRYTLRVSFTNAMKEFYKEYLRGQGIRGAFTITGASFRVSSAHRNDRWAFVTDLWKKTGEMRHNVHAKVSYLEFSTRVIQEKPRYMKEVDHHRFPRGSSHSGYRVERFFHG